MLPLRHCTLCLDCTTTHRAATTRRASTAPPHIMPRLHHRASCHHRHTAYCHAAATLVSPSHCWVSCHRSHAMVITPLGVLPSQSCHGHHTAARCTTGCCYVLCHHSCCCPLHHRAVVPRGAAVYGLAITLLHVLLWPSRCCVSCRGHRTAARCATGCCVTGHCCVSCRCSCYHHRTVVPQGAAVFMSPAHRCLSCHGLAANKT